MRDLDGRKLISRDFVLVSGDVVSNITLEPILNKHRFRRELDQNAIMTMVLREPGLTHRVRSQGRKPVFVVDPNTERCLHYEETGSRSGSSHCVSIDPSTLEDHKQIEIRGDLIDCHIDICTPDVLGLWTEYFDYRTLRRSFLHGVLKDYELNRKTIYAAITSDQYGARVKNSREYDVVSKDILGRWTYPLCPDSNMLPDHNYRFEKGNIYKEESVSIARSSAVKRKVVLGAQTTIRERSQVVDSTIGRNCKIGSNVVISDAYIWDDVEIGDGTKIQRAIVASGASIGKNCTVRPGALISFGAYLANGTDISGTSRIIRTESKEQGDDPEDESSRVEADVAVTAQVPGLDNDSDASSILGTPHNSRSSRPSLTEPSMSEFSDSDSDLEPLVETSRRSSLRSDPSLDSAPSRGFHNEATADILDGLQNDVSPENISLELVSLRMKENASQHQVRQAVVAAFMRRISDLMSGSCQPEISAREVVTAVFKNNKEIIRRTLFDQAEETKSDQVDFLMLVQKDAASRSKGASLLLFIAKELYDLGLVEEDGIMQWWDDDRSNTEDMKEVRALTEQFITFLHNAEEESDEASEKDNDE